MSATRSSEELYTDREKRLTDAIGLRVPDRVPIRFSLGYFPAKYTGITTETAYYNPTKWKWASQKLITEMDPDSYFPTTAMGSGLALEILGSRQVKWPGHGVSPYVTHQMLELEPMKGEEYAEFLSDPSDFIVHRYLPRVWDAAGSLEKLPSFKSLIGGASLGMFASRLFDSDLLRALDAIAKAGKATLEFQRGMMSLTDDMAGLGYPHFSPLMAGAPFDVISDNLRGMRGAMLDMYQHPDEVVKTCELFVPHELERAAQMAKMAKNKRVFMALHRGSDGFMSLRQFERFYWPTFKAVVLGLVDLGLTPCPFFEGIWDQRLEYLKELPKGKVVAHFAQTNMAKAKEVLGGHLCIAGDVPSSILQVGTVGEVEAYVKKLIQVCGRDGGFILTHMPIDDADPVLVKAMVDATKKYGVFG
jgi:hypothetical protein